MKKLLLAAALAAFAAPAQAADLAGRAAGYHMLNNYDRCFPGVVLPETLAMVALMHNMMDAETKMLGHGQWKSTRRDLNNNEELICMVLRMTGDKVVADLNRTARDLKRNANQPVTRVYFRPASRHNFPCGTRHPLG